MSSLFAIIFLASIVWFFVSKRRDKRSTGKVSKNTWYILILTAVSFVLVGATTPKQTQNTDAAKQTSNNSTSSSSAKKVMAASSTKESSSSKQQSKDKVVKSTKNSQLEALNDWYKNKYYDEQDAAYKKDGKEYFGTKEQIMQTALVGFKIENGDLISVINNNRLKGEKLTQKEVANYAFNVVYTDYSGDLPHYDNLSADGSIKQDVMLHPERYSTLE